MPTAAELRDALTDDVIANGYATDPRVADALRRVPREVFLPDVPLADAYANQAITIKENPDGGRPLSCASVPDIVAMMLDQLDVRPGHRILEIGAGSGVNAAYLAELAGPDGHITTVDIDPDVTTHARKALDNAGHTAVDVITADGALGHPANGPYDRIIVTVGAYDIPHAWRTQLAPSGTLVVPLRFRATTRSIALTPDGEGLTSTSVQLCGFIPMIGQDTERTAILTPDGHVTLYWDTDQPIEPAGLDGVFDQPRTAVWSGETIPAGRPYDGIWLRLAATHPLTCRIAADNRAVTTGVANPAHPMLTPALTDTATRSIAYFALKPPAAGEDTWALGAYGHGPRGANLATDICDAIRAWSPHRDAEPTIRVAPHRSAPSTDTPPPINKPSSTLTITY